MPPSSSRWRQRSSHALNSRETTGGRRAPAAPELDGDRAVAAAAGRSLFADLGCSTCHGGRNWTLSSLPGPVGSLARYGEVEVAQALRDVGTFDPDHDILGASGFDVPTLLGINGTAPYLHDGSSPTLEDVLANVHHVGRALEPSEVVALTEFLRSIDIAIEPF